jgi:hypothetical protein
VRFAAIALAIGSWSFACSSPALAQVPLGYWSFDGCNGTDASGNGKDLTVNGAPSCGPAHFGNGYTLNGSSDFLERSADTTFTPLNRAWSVVAWIKTTTIDPGLFVVVGWYRCGADEVCTGVDSDLYDLGLVDGHAFWDMRDHAGDDAPLQDSTVIADGNWHMLVGTNAPGVHAPQLYVDGVLKVQSTTNVGTLISENVLVPLEIGRQFRQGWASPSSYFPGSVDEVRILDFDLSPAQVATLYTSNTRTQTKSWGAIKASYR